MADLKIAIQKTLVHEGGFVNNSHDRGGPTKYGITQNDMPGVNIADITPEQAIVYYQEHYVKPLYSQINDQLLCEKIFDMGVLFGVGTAVRLLQISMAHHIDLVSDGTFGPNTLAATNQFGDLNQYKLVLAGHIVNVVTNHPGDAVFVQGWTTRVNS